jgi:hypothetical protein
MGVHVAMVQTFSLTRSYLEAPTAAGVCSIMSAEAAMIQATLLTLKVLQLCQLYVCAFLPWTLALINSRMQVQMQ